jgi:hypothetical protein
MLKIFSDKAYVPLGREHVVMLYPFWGKNPEEVRDPSSGRFDRYAETGARFFQMTTLADADVAILPVDWTWVTENVESLKSAERFIQEAGRLGKPAVVFYWSDSDRAIEYKHALVFRTSLYRSRQRPNEFAMPAWSEDFVAKYLSGQAPLRPKRARATVGFCGYAPSVAPESRALGHRVQYQMRKGKSLLKSLLRQRADASIRLTALQGLQGCPGIDTNFVLRASFFGSVPQPDRPIDWGRLQQARQEYVRNVIASDYVLCVRGAGNFSYRLYEVLSCGRIPVFVDTDCVLPYSTRIDWKADCVWVDEKDIRQIGARVAEFHAALSDAEFVERQQRCRKLWEDYLSPEGFFRNFQTHLACQRKAND